MDNYKRINISSHITIPWVDRPPMLVLSSATVIQMLSQVAHTARANNFRLPPRNMTVIVNSRLNKRRYPTQYTQAVVERLRIGYAMAGVRYGCGSTLMHKPPQ